MLDSILGGNEVRKRAWALEEFCTRILKSPPALTAWGASESGAKAPGTGVGSWGPWMTCTSGVMYNGMRIKLGVLGEGEEDGLEATARSKEHLSHWQAQESQGPGRENNYNWEGTSGKQCYWGEPGVRCTQEKKAKGTLTRKVKDRGFAAP